MSTTRLEQLSNAIRESADSQLPTNVTLSGMMICPDLQTF